MGYSFADASTRETEPDYRIVLEAGVRAVLKHFGFRRRLFEINTRLLTRRGRISPKCSIETVASISSDGKINTELVVSML